MFCLHVFVNHIHSDLSFLVLCAGYNYWASAQYQSHCVLSHERRQHGVKMSGDPSHRAIPKWEPITHCIGLALHPTVRC